MRVHHRIPNVFSLSMLDVLCCALGCVILLWLLNLREASDRAVEVSQATGELVSVQSQLELAKAEILQLVTARNDSRMEAQRLEGERAITARELKQAQAKLRDLDRQLSALLARTESASEQLAEVAKERRTLQKQKENAELRITDLEMLIAAQSNLGRNVGKKLEAAQLQLKDAEARLEKIQAEARDARTKLIEADAREKALTAKGMDTRRNLDDASKSMETLQREKQALIDQISRARQQAESRFEGITLAGRRIVFMVDMSGSMELVDEQTPDQQKWLGVRETLAKVMRSLPDLERYQVILFSDKVLYPMGGEGAWLEFDVKSTPEKVLAAMAGIKPHGSTNMYAAFEAAFRYRPLGMDSLFILSDGLPNMGPGLTPQQDSTLTKEMDRAEILAKHIRSTLKSDWNRGQPKVRIQTIGFFYESPDVGAFLWALARENEGSFVGMSKP